MVTLGHNRYDKNSNDVYVWMDDTPVESGFTVWRSGQPSSGTDSNEMAVDTDSGQKKWVDLVNDVSKKYICEVPGYIPCTSPFTAVGSSCLYGSTTELDWNQARDECVAMGAHLVMIKTASKQQDVEDYITAQSSESLQQNLKAPSASMYVSIRGLDPKSFFI